MYSNAVVEGLRKFVRGAVHRTGWGLTLEDKEDAEQEAMMDLYIRLHEIPDRPDEQATDTDAYAGLATRIGRFSAIDLARRKQNPARNAQTGVLGPQDSEGISLEAILSESVHTQGEPSMIDTVIHWEMLDHLRQNLNPRDLVFLELVGRGYTDSEIAEHYNLPVLTVKSRIQDWKKKCRRILTAYDSDAVSQPLRSRTSDARRKAKE